MQTKISKTQARRILIESSGLSSPITSKVSSLKQGPRAVTEIIEQIGYLQIDTINVIERCHHHILYNRLYGYKKAYLHKAQSESKSIFEYWTHALSFIPYSKYHYYIPQMQQTKKHPGYWLGSVETKDLSKVRRLLKDGPINIREIKDDQLKEKLHEWDSQKPSKRALQFGFYNGEFVISKREGMLKYYDLAKRHFDWKFKPRAATRNQVVDYLVDRALTSQGIVSLDSICHLQNKYKIEVLKRLQMLEKSRKLLSLNVEGINKINYWCKPELLSSPPKNTQNLHILSPFDPLVIQRKRLVNFFDFEYIFEAYVPPNKRRYGYFSLPVLVGDKFVSLLDLKADRSSKNLIINNWHWLNKSKSKELKKLIENELHNFEKFQFEGL